MKHNRIWLLLTLVALSLFALSLAAAAADNVVFLATGGTGDGSSPDAPIGRLTAAMDAWPGQGCLPRLRPCRRPRL